MCPNKQKQKLAYEVTAFNTRIYRYINTLKQDCGGTRNVNYTQISLCTS